MLKIKTETFDSELSFIYRVFWWGYNYNLKVTPILILENFIPAHVGTNHKERHSDVRNWVTC